MKLSWPLRKEFPILQSNLFGANPQNYASFGLAGHDGIDIMCPTGEDVVAPIAGECYVGWDPKGWGLYIRITNNEGEVILAHLLDNLISSGTTVTQGALIAHSNSTGNSSGPHLHLGLKVNAISNPPMKDFIDPMPYLQDTTEPTMQITVKERDFLVGRSTTAKEVGEYLNLDNPDNASTEDYKRVVGGYIGRATELQTKLTIAEAEITNKDQQVGRLKQQLLEETELATSIQKQLTEMAKIYEGRIGALQEQVDAMGKDKGLLITENALLKSQLDNAIKGIVKNISLLQLIISKYFT